MSRIVPTAVPAPQWERHDPRLRLHLYDGPTNELSVYDMVESSVEEAQESARMASDGDARLWSLAMVHESSSIGVIWLSGCDYRRAPGSPIEWRLRGQMQDRYLAARSQCDEPVVLPDGLRVIRLFPEWGVDLPLWESFADRGYPFEPGALPIDAALERQLSDWNREWESFGFEAPRPKAWFERGWELHARLQGTLADIAEVRPVFSWSVDG